MVLLPRTNHSIPTFRRLGTERTRDLLKLLLMFDSCSIGYLKRFQKARSCCELKLCQERQAENVSGD